MVFCSRLTKGESFTATIETDFDATGLEVRPSNGKKILLMIDDLNLAHKDKYGTQSTCSVIRQWFDYEGWYRLKP
jgi:hypothetical protein